MLISICKLTLWKVFRPEQLQRVLLRRGGGGGAEGSTLKVNTIGFLGT